jgi:hypothetical protein
MDYRRNAPSQPLQFGKWLKPLEPFTSNKTQRQIIDKYLILFDLIPIVPSLPMMWRLSAGFTFEQGASFESNSRQLCWKRDNLLCINILSVVFLKIHKPKIDVARRLQYTKHPADQNPPIPE